MLIKNQPKSDHPTIGIVGYGYVGQAFYKLFDDWIGAIYDPKISGEDGKKDFKNVDMAIVSVPTPTSDDGKTCDHSIVESSVKWLKDTNPDLLVLVKSTTPPLEALRIKETHKTRVVFSPEYIGEGGYFVPFWKYPDPKEVKYHDFQIFGGDPKDTSACVDIFIRRMGSHVHFYQTDIKTACLTKYMENSWLATKLTFCSEWYGLAKTYGVDYNELRELWLADRRVERSHTAVYPDKRGYGGRCLPKDTKAILSDAEKHGFEMKLLGAVDKINESNRE